MLNTLTALGFKEIDAHVYLFLTKGGFKKAREIAEARNLHKSQLYQSLKNLKSNGVVNWTPERPTRFSAVPFERVLDLLMEVKKEQQKALKETREQLFSTWQLVAKKYAASKS